ncbi:MAG TPA: phytanoyl-CoA dioxygenase family protein [Solirubrobacteraceae bacterium]|nr:phytanoyl-CoA dioxygenase family protein [Solirubrobacteraceae bacterium]
MQTPQFQDADHMRFRERGYAIVNGLFEPAEIERLRTTALDTVAELGRQGRGTSSPGGEGVIRGCEGDLLSNPALRAALLDPRVLGTIGGLLGGEPTYFGDSSVRIGRNGERGWHRDNVDRRRWRRGPDWHEGPYPLIRCGLYLQDQARHSGGLALRPGSNGPGLVRPTRPKLVAAQAGDLVVWELRTVHSGEVVRMRGLPRVPLHPRVQTLLPEGLRVPEGRERIVLFMTFALPGPDLDRYLDYLRSREYMRDAWSRSRFGSDGWEAAERAGLSVLRPLPAYGTPLDGAA